MNISFEKLSARENDRGSVHSLAPQHARGATRNSFPSGGVIAPSNAERAAKWFSFLFFGLFFLAPFIIAGVFILSD